MSEIDDCKNQILDKEKEIEKWEVRAQNLDTKIESDLTEIQRLKTENLKTKTNNKELKGKPIFFSRRDQILQIQAEIFF